MLPPGGGQCHDPSMSLLQNVLCLAGLTFLIWLTSGVLPTQLWEPLLQEALLCPLTNGLGPSLGIPQLLQLPRLGPDPLACDCGHGHPPGHGSRKGEVSLSSLAPPPGPGTGTFVN